MFTNLSIWDKLNRAFDWLNDKPYKLAISLENYYPSREYKAGSICHELKCNLYFSKDNLFFFKLDFYNFFRHRPKTI